MEGTKLERILCPVDFSEFSSRAYAYASSLAHHCGAKLFVQHVIETCQYPCSSFAPTVDDYEEFWRAIRAQSQEQLRSFIAGHTANHVETESVTCEGVAADCILTFANQHEVNLIVMGTHGVRGFERLMLGSATERVLRKAACPVLAVPKLPPDLVASMTAGNDVRVRQILACADFSDSSKEAVNFAISVAEDYDAELTVVNVLEAVSAAGCAEETAIAYKHLDELFPRQTGLGSRIRTAVRIGRPFREISKLALEIRADVAIMGARGRNSVDAVFFGSTTYRVVQSGVCPVLSVRD